MQQAETANLAAQPPEHCLVNSFRLNKAIDKPIFDLA